MDIGSSSCDRLVAVTARPSTMYTEFCPMTSNCDPFTRIEVFHIPRSQCVKCLLVVLPGLLGDAARQGRYQDLSSPCVYYNTSQDLLLAFFVFVTTDDDQLP